MSIFPFLRKKKILLQKKHSQLIFRKTKKVALLNYIILQMSFLIFFFFPPLPRFDFAIELKMYFDSILISKPRKFLALKSANLDIC